MADPSVVLVAMPWEVLSSPPLQLGIDELVSLRLVYHENGRYLSLALSAQLPESASTLTETAVSHNQEEHPSGQGSMAGRSCLLHRPWPTVAALAMRAVSMDNWAVVIDPDNPPHQPAFMPALPRQPLRQCCTASLWVIILGLLLAACGDSGGSGGPSGTPVSLRIEPDSLELQPGVAGKFTAVGLDSSGRRVSIGPVTWTAGPGVQVTSTGRATAQGTVRTYVSAEANGLRAFGLVKLPGALGIIVLSSASDTLVPGDSVRVTATMFADSAGNPLPPAPLIWSVSDPTLATVSATGVTIGKWPGVVTVLAGSGIVEGTAILRVLVPVASVELSPDSLTVAPGAVYFASVVLRDSAGGTITGRGVTWTRSPAAQVSVTGSGRVVTLAPGLGRAIASVEGHADTTLLQVTDLAFSNVSAGGSHSCGVATDHSLWCWGRNDSLQLSNPEIGEIAGPTRVRGNIAWDTVAVGLMHSCALTTAGAAYCWGSNEFGQLGNGSTTSSAIPVPVAGGRVFTSISIGGVHGCGLQADSTAFCWGPASQGRLGNGTMSGVFPNPVAVLGGLHFRLITAGAGHTCGLVADGSAYCWGGGADRERGTDNAADPSLPAPVLGGLQYRSIAGGGFHTCGVTVADVAYCWGRNINGQLGTGGGEESSPAAVQAHGLLFTDVTAGLAHTCAVATTGTVYCWGDTNFGASGPAGGPVPSQVLVGAAVASGAYHSCARSTTAWLCWGRNDSWQLGTGDVAGLGDSRVDNPTRVTGQP